MKFILKKGDPTENIYNSLRNIGYRFQEKDEKNSEFIFIRPLHKIGYPRFHLYVKNMEEKLIFDLHLDQKKPIYKGAHAHSGEYEGEILEKEVKRIKENLL